MNGPGVISSGVEKSGVSGVSVYEQKLFGQPFFVQGDWDKVEGTAENKNITAFLPRGTTAEEKKQAEAVIALAGNARTFYASLLGPAPDVPIRLVSVRRGSGFSDGGTILLEPGAFRRTKLDATTAMIISEAMSRLWIGGQTAVRGEGGGLLRDAMPRFLATLFIEKQFGRDAAQEELLRERLAYSAVAKRDAPVAQVTPLDATYFSAVPNKGAMVWRLIESRIGRDAFISTLRGLLQSAGGNTSGISLAALRGALVQRGGQPLKALIDQQMDQVTDLDLMIGVPQQRGSEWVSALRNLGSIDALTTARAITPLRPLSMGPIPARNFGDAVSRPGEDRAGEIDPDTPIHTDYSRTPPRARYLQDLWVKPSCICRTGFREVRSFARSPTLPHMHEARIALTGVALTQSRIEKLPLSFDELFPARFACLGQHRWANPLKNQP